jgi:hypothetical protein
VDCIGADAAAADAVPAKSADMYAIPGRSKKVGRQALMYHVISKALVDMPDKTGNLNDVSFIDRVNRYLKKVSPSGLRKGKLFTKKVIKKANKANRHNQAFAPYVINSGKKRSESCCILQLKDPKKGKVAVDDYYSQPDPPPESDSSDSLEIVRRAVYNHHHEAGPSTRA